ncbi:hypothetical protein JWG40_17255 [Leptospira sp. 201903074]|uniref:LA2681 family HEPN domain-containing protein n=1 Tax=Leptospira abararensis TaxID=2810036 RepID=UPI001964384A|nr:LA2681 family HEPN domain-containing protein [Leptospira abararensis]MBM9548776.1 hypothetical protein [Leptospira abararensis]
MKDLERKIEKLGHRIDQGLEKKDVNQLKKCIEEASEIESYLIDKVDNANERSILSYFVGNAWYNLDLINKRVNNKSWAYDRIEQANAIKYFRKCVNEEKVSKSIISSIHIKAYTNLGNMFSLAGRSIYALECWKKALSINPNFAMAGCCFSHGLIQLANFFHDENHKFLSLKYAYKGLSSFLKSKDIHSNAREVFNQDVIWIKSNIYQKHLDSDFKFRTFSLGKTKNEKEYKQWVLKKSLFLNPLNDLFYESAIAHDVLNLPNMRVVKYDTPFLHGFFNQNNDLAYSIKETNFDDKVFKILKCAREAIIYLSLSIHVEESRNNSSNDLVIPLELPNYD